MSKIGIMSMQKIKNYGSFLQAYALKKMIEKLGNNVEFVDYHIEKTLISDEKKSNAISKVFDTLRSDGKLIHKIQYIRHKKEFGKKNFNKLGILKEENYNPKLDTLVIGSDEVFNCIQKNKNVGYSLELFSKDNNAKRVISYAASFGNTTFAKIKNFNKENELSELLKNFDSISVRDENSGKIIKKLTGKEPYYNLDPVLVYDYMTECCEIPKIKPKEKYMILYAYSGRITKEEAKGIKEYCKNKNVKIYSIGGVQPYADKFIDCSPFEVLAYFKNAEFIITDTFHGSIFSIINNKKFVTIVRKSIGDEYGNEEKLSDLLKRLSLNEMIVYDVKNIDKVLSKEISYEIVNKIINNERKKTIEYLKENL